jgi:putative acetyltransferase
MSANERAPRAGTAMIRPYRTSDPGAVLQAWEGTSALAHPFLPRDFLVTEREALANAFLTAAETWVRETEGRVVGFISLRGNEIGRLFVHPEFGRRGIGHAFVDHARYA